MKLASSTTQRLLLCLIVPILAIQGLLPSQGAAAVAGGVQYAAVQNDVSPAAGLAAGATLLFDEEFDGTSLNTSKWTDGYWWDNNGCTIGSNNELEWYQPDDIIVSGGTLKLKAEKRTIVASDGKTYNYTSGVVTTGRDLWQDPSPDKFALKYGYVEMRAKLPKGKGLWPAFWLLSGDQSWPPEIDVMEVLGDSTNVDHMTLHDASGGSTGHTWSGPDLSADWHVYGVDWQPNAIVWYVDGVERWRFTDTSRIPAETMYLLLNLAVGGDWPGSPDGSTVFPAYYEVDYVRAWSQVPTGAPTDTPTAPATATTVSTTTPPSTYHVFHGGLHNHTADSDGSGTPQQAFAAGSAIQRAGGYYDFMAVTDHSEQLSDAEWLDIGAQADNYNKDGTFVALRGTEWSNDSTGHMCIYNTSTHPAASGSATTYLVPEPNLSDVYGWLGAHPEAIAQFNHPNRIDFNGFAYDGRAEQAMQVLEVDNRNEGWAETKYVSALDTGWHVGATAGQDTHDAKWGDINNYPGRTGIWASDLTRGGVLEALDSMRTFATQDPDFEISLKGNGAWMGQTIQSGGSPVNLQVYLHDPDGERITNVSLITNRGTVVQSMVPPSNPYTWNPNPISVSGDQYFYVRVDQANGHKIATSPIWVSANQPPAATTRGRRSTATNTPPPPATTNTPTLTPTPGIPPTRTDIMLRTTTSGNNGAGASTLTLNAPAGLLGGDVLVAQVVVRGATTTITPPAGWSLIRRDQSTGSIAVATILSPRDPARAQRLHLDVQRLAGGVRRYCRIRRSGFKPAGGRPQWAVQQHHRHDHRAERHHHGR